MLTRIPLDFSTKADAQHALTRVRKEYRVALRGACVTGPDYHKVFTVHAPLDGTGFSAAELAAVLRKYR